MRTHYRRLGLFCAVALGLALLSNQPAWSGGKQQFDPNGEPKGFKAGEPARYAVWHTKGVWHLRTTTAKKPHHFKGKVFVEGGGTFDGIQSILLETKGKYEDYWVVHPKKHEIAFDFKTDRGVDGIDFEVTKDAKTLHFNLHIDGKHYAEKIFIGKGNHHPDSDPFNLPAHPAKKKAGK